jgi:hypothetical protein
MKAIIIAAALQQQGAAVVEAIVCNGGHQAHERTALAYTGLKHMGMSDKISVAEGTAGMKHEPEDYEYGLDGFGHAMRQQYPEGSSKLFEVLQDAELKSISIVILAGFTDVADITRNHAELVKSKVKEICCMGGMRKSNSVRWGWEADTAHNNEFDQVSAAEVYNFCFLQQIPMKIVTRNGAPKTSMDLERRFSQKHVLIRYLSEAQSKSLIALWKKVCVGGILPKRCSKQWFFATFCGIPERQFENDDTLPHFDETDDILPYLVGGVSASDPVALLAALSPDTDFDLEGAAIHVNGCTHHIFDTAAHGPTAASVEGHLTAAYMHLLEQ